MNRIKTIVQDNIVHKTKRIEKRILYNVEDFCNAFNIPLEFWNKNYERFKRYVEGQKRLGIFGLYNFLFANRYIETIHGASGEHKYLYCSKGLIQEVLRLEVKFSVEEVY